MSNILDKLVRDFSFTAENQTSFIFPSPVGLVPVITTLDVTSDAAAVVSLSLGGTQALLNVDCTNPHSDVTFRSLRGGDSGAGLNIIYTDPSANDVPLAVAVTINTTPATGGFDIDIDVTLSTSGAGAIIATAQEIIDFVNADETFRLYAEAYKSASNNGTGVVEAKVSAPLAGQAETLKWREETEAAAILHKAWAPGGMKGIYAGDDVKVDVSAGTDIEINVSGFWIPGSPQSPRFGEITPAEELIFA